jgi:hypothetical protein
MQNGDDETGNGQTSFFSELFSSPFACFGDLGFSFGKKKSKSGGSNGFHRDDEREEYEDDPYAGTGFGEFDSDEGYDFFNTVKYCKFPFNDNYSLGKLFADEKIGKIFDAAREFDKSIFNPHRNCSFEPVVDKDSISKKVGSFCENQKKLLNSKISFPFVRKLNAKNGDKLLMVGDLHGRVYSLIRILACWIKMEYMNKYLELADNVKVIFTGDLTDRWYFGVEVWEIVLDLIEKNPGKVFVTRGNHETKDLANEENGLFDELKEKYKKTFGLENSFQNLWSFLPSAIFLNLEDGSRIMFNHGGFPDRETFFNEAEKLEKFFEDEKKIFMKISKNFTFALLWNDYIPGEGIFVSKRGKKISDVGVDYVQKACEDLNIKNIFRAHAHNGSVVSFLYEYEQWRSVKIEEAMKLSAQFVYTIMGSTEGLNPIDKFGGVDGFCVLEVGKNYESSTITAYQYKIPLVTRR